MKKSIPLAALLGVAPFSALLGAASFIATSNASAAPVAAELVSVRQWGPVYAYSPFNLSVSTATWTFDAAAGEAVITGGTYIGVVVSPAIFGHTMTGVTLGNFVPTLGTWSCQEGTFGPAVGASFCGLYNFGSNKTNESTYTPTVQGATVAIGGDDGASGVPQTMASSYSFMTTTYLGDGQFRLDNRGYDNCPYSGTDPCRGYDFVFQVVPIPPAVWLFGSALGVMGVMRRKFST